jgi:hypothetical protein
MMRKYVTAYALWFAAVLAMAVVAIGWYRHVEEIGLRELASRLRATDDPEATEADAK